MTTTATQIAVRYPTDDEMPPIPIRENGTHEELMAGHYQNVVLDLAAATLTVECSDWRDPYNNVGITDADLFSGLHWTYVPDRLCWIIDSGAPAFPYLDATGAARLLDELAGHAQRLVDSLVAVPDTTAWDWSEDAVHQGDHIGTLVTRDRAGKTRLASVVDMDAAVAACPQLADVRWAWMDDDQLEDAAEYLFTTSEVWYPELNELVGGAQRVEVLGIRAWLYGYRRRAAGEREIVGAHTWFAERREGLDVADDQIDRRLASEQHIAADQNRHLVGGRSYLKTLQASQRRAVLSALEQDASDVAVAEAELERARLRRGSRVAQVLSWQSWGSDAELARRAGMSRQGIAKVRERFGIERDDEDTVRE